MTRHRHQCPQRHDQLPRAGPPPPRAVPSHVSTARSRSGSARPPARPISARPPADPPAPARRHPRCGFRRARARPSPARLAPPGSTSPPGAFPVKHPAQVTRAPPIRHASYNHDPAPAAGSTTGVRDGARQGEPPASARRRLRRTIDLAATENFTPNSNSPVRTLSPLPARSLTRSTAPPR